MLYDFVSSRAQEWLRSDNCAIGPIYEHMSKSGKLRDAQTQALLVYLYLKIEGRNKPLSALFAEGFFNRNEDLASLNINQIARTTLEDNPAARALFELARTTVKRDGKSGVLFPDLEKHIIHNPTAIDYDSLSSRLFYGVEYPDYLFSLPMGAGKTFLMAAIIYLDLYFALNEPDNPQFAHNFLIMVPSGLKSSVIPSLKTIERFDPSWVLPEPAASNIKRIIRFEVLDQPKSAKRSNKARNPNAQKISSYQPFESQMGLVLVVNAEKVILDRLELTKQLELIEKTDDEKDRFANELRNIIGKIPNLQIHIDEVHHAATDDIKLRQVVNKWSEGGSINSVLGFSGTPYLKSAETINISDDIKLKCTQITNTVFYYPLTTAIRKFLKKPRVEQTSGLSSIEIIDKGINDFLNNYGDTVYSNGCIAKLAVYCGSIERLEEEVYPRLIGNMKIKPEEILKYHRGNKKYKITKEAGTEFNSLDTPLSKKKIILLVQIGKEGWDCRSLTGVILSQKGDCPANMVLQTSCRCLRQVEKAGNETALIWLNDENAKTLDKQLREEQHTSIQELTNSGKNGSSGMVERYSRIDHLKLPRVNFYQLQVEYETVVIDEEAAPQEAFANLDAKDYLDTAVVTERGLSPDEIRTKSFVEEIEGDPIEFDRWIYDISRESIGSVNIPDLCKYEKQLIEIFNGITCAKENVRVYNNLFRHDEIRSRIRLAFHRHREFKVKTEIIPKSANLLIIEKLLPIEEHPKLYPPAADVQVIINYDKTGKDIQFLRQELEEARKKLLEFIAAQPDPDLFATAGLIPAQRSYTKAVMAKDKTYHYLPYDFIQSRFEMSFLKEVLSLKDFIDSDLEIYYNGERKLTEFKIACYEKKGGNWRKVGDYTPDFLVIKRQDDLIHKILIIETKGSGFADQHGFVARKSFVESEFLEMNNDKFDYKRFDYLYLLDDNKMDDNLRSFNSKVTAFFLERV